MGVSTVKQPAPKVTAANKYSSIPQLRKTKQNLASWIGLHAAFAASSLYESSSECIPPIIRLQVLRLSRATDMRAAP